MTRILITGGNGQLASSIKAIQNRYCDFEFIYTDTSVLDITNYNQVETFFKSYRPDFCINCAAYTAVDSAEIETELAEQINTFAVGHLARICNTYETTLIHLSTDFVFEGNQSSLYREFDITQPLSVYGSTKLKGEQRLLTEITKFFIIRTSWLYSEFGNNFMKTMIRLAQNRDQLTVVADQIGTPTYAQDLALVLCEIVKSKSTAYGIYHYSNEGVASWYDFAKSIFEFNQTEIDVLPIRTESFPTPAKRPVFSVLDKTKIKTNFNIRIPYWRDSLQIALKNYNGQ